MILVADSGSTKTSWALLINDDIQHVESKGINPYFNTEDDIKNLLEKIFTKDFIQKVTKIHFYGAGCNAEDNKKKLSSSLKAVFQNTKFLEVNDDLTAALRATCGNKEGIACILGTGSGSVYGNNGNVLQTKLGNGIWLGDEGSGGHLGKLLIKSYLDGEVPNHLRVILEKEHLLSRASILQKVYREEKPNVYLASFTHFIKKHENELFISQLIKENFQQFFKKSISIYEDYKALNIHFVGSIASHFSQFLQTEIEKNNCKLGSIIQKPINNLLAYHINS